MKADLSKSLHHLEWKYLSRLVGTTMEKSEYRNRKNISQSSRKYVTTLIYIYNVYMYYLIWTNKIYMLIDSARALFNLRWASTSHPSARGWHNVYWLTAVGNFLERKTILPSIQIYDQHNGAHVSRPVVQLLSGRVHIAWSLCEKINIHRPATCDELIPRTYRI